MRSKLSMSMFTTKMPMPESIGIQSFYGSIFRLIPDKYLFSLLRQIKTVIEAKKGKQINTVRVYLDLKSGLPFLYTPRILEVLSGLSNVEKETAIRELVASIFITLNLYVKYSVELLNADSVLLVLFADGGGKIFHRSISKEYKSHRKSPIVNLPAPKQENIKDLLELIFKVYLKDLASEITDKLNRANPSITVKYQYVYLDNVESDFIPRFYITQLDNSQALNIVCSTDKDIFQVVEYPTNTLGFRFNYSKHTITLIDQRNVYANIAKKEEVDDSYMLRYKHNVLDQLLALAGDRADYVKPLISGIGFSKWLTIYKQLEDVPDLNERALHKVFQAVMSDNYSSAKENLLHYIKPVLERQKTKTAVKILGHLEAEDFYKQLKANYLLVSFDALIANLRAVDYKYLLDLVNQALS